jgi:hypothetical protein
MIFVTYNDTSKVINNYKTKQLEGTKWYLKRLLEYIY